MLARLADSLFESAVETEPANAFAHIGRGIAQRSLGESLTSVGCCRIGVALAPRNPWVRTQLAISLYEAGLFAESRLKAAEACELPGVQGSGAERVAAAARGAERVGLAEVVESLRSMLDEVGIRHRIQLPVRTPASRGWTTEEDTEGPPIVRVITGSVKDCYGVVGVVHAEWPPIPGRFEDHIAMPCVDSCQSLHTDVRIPGGGTLRLQIRTEDMHSWREFAAGLSSGFVQPEGGPEPSIEQLRGALAELAGVPLDHGTYGVQSFCRALGRLPNVEHIVLLTPRGDLVLLPNGACLLDFAYHIHTDVGDSCQGGTVDGLEVPASCLLKGGECVEVNVADSRVAPRPEWLDLVVTRRARRCIRKSVCRRTP